jgi:hypothetical protein
MDTYILTKNILLFINKKMINKTLKRPIPVNVYHNYSELQSNVPQIEILKLMLKFVLQLIKERSLFYSISKLI